MGSNKQPLGLEHMVGRERKNIHHYLVMGKNQVRNRHHFKISKISKAKLEADTMPISFKVANFSPQVMGYK